MHVLQLTAGSFKGTWAKFPVAPVGVAPMPVSFGTHNNIMASAYDVQQREPRGKIRRLTFKMLAKYRPPIALSVSMKISRSRLSPTGLYLELNLSNR